MDAPEGIMASRLQDAHAEYSPRYSVFQCDIDWLGVYFNL
jgi:hypothetical protein